MPSGGRQERTGWEGAVNEVASGSSMLDPLTWSVAERRYG